MRNRPPVSVVVLSYMKSHRLDECLRSLVKIMRCGQDQLIIVDNSVPGEERDKVYNVIKRIGNRFTAEVVYNQTNLKFSRGINQGIELAVMPYVVLVNNDTKIIYDDTFQHLTGLMERRRRAASVTPVTIHSNGSVYCSGAFGSGAHRRDKLDKPRRTEWNNFAFVCLRQSVIKEIGMLATGRQKVGQRPLVNCRHFHSDEEWCRRATEARYAHWVHPVEVYHFHKEG